MDIFWVRSHTSIFSTTPLVSGVSLFHQGPVTGESDLDTTGKSSMLVTLI